MTSSPNHNFSIHRDRAENIFEEFQNDQLNTKKNYYEENSPIFRTKANEFQFNTDYKINKSPININTFT